MCQQFLSKALKEFKKIDIFGHPVQLFIKQESGHKTLFGAFLTLIIFAFFGCIFTTNLMTLSNRTNPVSYTTDVYHPDPHHYLLHPDNFTLTFAFQSSDTKTYIDESVYIVEATLNRKILNMVNGTQKIDWEAKEIPIAPCSNGLLRQKSLDNFFSHIDQPTNYCIDWNKIDQLSLEGTFNSPEYYFILLQFKACNEQTQKQKTCKSREEIKTILEQNYFSLQLSSHVIDVKNEKQPFQPTGQDLFTTISSKIFKEISIYLQPISIFSDFGIFTEDIQQEQALRYLSNSEMIDLNENDLIMNVVIRLDQVEQQYYRSYPKFFVILSQLGGLWQIIFTVALIIQKPINRLSYYLRILNSLFQFEQPQITNSIEIKEDQKKQSSLHQYNSNNQFTSQREVIISDTVTRTSQRLKSIKLKKAQLEELEKINEDANLKQEMKFKLSQTIQQSIKKYFQSISKKLKFNFLDYFLFFISFFKTENYKALQASYSIQKTCRYLDIIQILKKLQEIDKLKMVLLSDAQIKVFDYLQKPTIPLNPKKISQETLHNFQNYPLLSSIKSNYKRAIDAQKAFKELVKNLNDPISRKLISFIDNNIADFLQLSRQSENFNLEDSQIDEECGDKNQVLVLQKTTKKIISKQILNDKKQCISDQQMNNQNDNIVFSDDEVIY